MSYCRFSSDDFQCDVYVYEDCSGGWTTHVAGNRVLFDSPLPKPVPLDLEHVHEFTERHKAVMALVESSRREPIGLPHDGEHFNDSTPQECADRLEALRALGYNVPQYAIDALLEEAAE